MPSSSSSTAIQYVSFKGYQRLKDALLLQRGLFASVVTEAEFEPKFLVPAGLASTGRAPTGVSAAGMETTERGVRLGHADSESPACFVVMRSPALDVLLVGTPLSKSESAALGAPMSGAQSAGDRTAQQQRRDHSMAKRNIAYQHAAHRLSTNPQHAAASNSPQATADSKQVSRSIAAIQDLFRKADVAADSSLHSPAYQVSLSFDKHTVLSFLNQLTPSSTFHVQESSGKKMVEGKVSAQEKFVLSWANQLASAPDGSAQAILDNQVQQSLLLNQVITRIRHSLDLPAILETTVAQVREFLSADRLVLYQFDQIETVDLSSPSSTTPFSLNESTEKKGESNAQSSSSSLHNSATTELITNSGTIIGRCTHEGHVTYESRLSEAIPSVLDYSETDCFMPSLSIRDRYIMGQPVAIDDVDQQYAHAECLLDLLHQAQVKSKIIAPIIVQDQLWGLLIAHQCEDYRHWQETEVVFLQHIAEHLAVAISQAGLYQQLQKQTVSLESCVVERTQNLHDALLAAESANLTKGEFLSTMSHELRTPLTYIIGMSATLMRWSFGELSDRQRSYLNTINHSGEQLLEIINDILDFAKISSGRAFLDVSEFSLSSLVREVMDHFQSIADKQGIKLLLQFDVSPAEDAFQADPKRLRQIIANLIHNAVKFTPTNGQVTLRVAREGEIGVFQVEDTGIGIPESQRGLLFEKFKQLESPFQRQYSGTGLGLAMTKRLVELHAGTIQVKSTVNKGSVFSVRLPVQMPDLVRDRYQVPLTLSDRSKRILLLEVQENSAAIICDLLTADGYEVIWQEDVDKVLSQLASLQPAMLIADLSLLSHDVDEIKKIQLSITDMNAKVLALLGQPMSHSSHIAHHDTLEKPIDPKKLLEKVRQLTLIATS